MERSAILDTDGDSVVFGIDGFDRSVSAARETEFLTAAMVKNYLTDFVVSGMGTLSFSEITIDEDYLLSSRLGYVAATSEQIADGG